MQKNLKNTLDILRIPFKVAPVYAAIIAIQKVIEGLIPLLNVLAIAGFLDTAKDILNGDKSFDSIVFPIILVVLILIYSWMSNGLIKFIEVKLQIRLKETTRVEITEKRAKLQYKYIEDGDTWNLISRLSEEPELQIKKGYVNFLTLAAMYLRGISLIVLLSINVWWTGVVMLFISMALFKIAVKNGEDNYDAYKENSKHIRKFQYYEKILTGRESAAERTLFGYSDEINNKWEEQYEITRVSIFKTQIKNFVRSRRRTILAIVSTVVLALVLLKPVEMGVISIGLYIGLVNALFEFSDMFSWRLTFYVDDLTQSREYMNELNQFFNLEEKEEALSLPAQNGITLKTLEFRNVYFKYPNTDNYILKNLSFTLKEGGHYAVVGVNGAGKTTITKLITGLYDNFEGDILVNGKSIRDYNQGELKTLTTVVFQDFARYFISLKDNISIGNINKIGITEQEIDLKNAIDVIELNNLQDKLPKGIDSNLGKIKSDGVDLSGGQWQRIGMARSIMSPASLRILDEPTAALDPISESNIYEQFEKISKGTTTLFISHRLASTQIADEIFVIGDGTVIERGSHEKLLSMEGIYAEMYKSQRSWYL